MYMYTIHIIISSFKVWNKFHSNTKKKHLSNQISFHPQSHPKSPCLFFSHSKTNEFSARFYCAYLTQVNYFCVINTYWVAIRFRCQSCCDIMPITCLQNDQHDVKSMAKSRVARAQQFRSISNHFKFTYVLCVCVYVCMFHILFK